MLVRVLLIPLLLIQQLALPLAASGAPAASCAVPSCCEIVETTTCCGEVIAEQRCGRTGGECRCEAAPEDTPPAPAPRAPGEQNDAGPIFLVRTARALDLLAPVRASARRAAPAIHRSHNETRALLCIWRT